MYEDDEYLAEQAAIGDPMWLITPREVRAAMRRDDAENAVTLFGGDIAHDDDLPAGYAIYVNTNRDEIAAYLAATRKR